MVEETEALDIEEAEEHLANGIEFLKEMNIEREYEDTFDFSNGLLYTCSLALGTDHIKAAIISNETGLFHARQGNFGYACFLLYSAIKFWQKNPKQICEETINTYVYLGITYTLEPAFALGKECFKNAHEVLKRIKAEKSEKAAEVLCFEAALHMTQDDWETSVKLTQQSLEMLAELGIEKTYFKGECLLNIAKILRYQKKIMDALTYCQMSVHAYWDFYGKGHSILDPVLDEWKKCLELHKEESGSEILDFQSENN